MSLSPIGNTFMYIETSSNIHGEKVFVSFGRTDIIQISDITFYFNRFSFLTNDFLEAVGRFRIQLFLEDKTCVRVIICLKMIYKVILQLNGRNSM